MFPTVRRLLKWLLGPGKKLGAIDILVNNAGTNLARRKLTELSVEDFDRVVDVNLKGAYYCVHEVLPKMRERRQGLIINVSSVAGVRASVLGGTAYSASKFGMSALSLMIGLEEGANGIRSCMICPGEVNTPILEDRPVVPTAEKRAVMLQPEDLAQAAPVRGDVASAGHGTGADHHAGQPKVRLDRLPAPPTVHALGPEK